jgi:hypothetical protein
MNLVVYQADKLCLGHSYAFKGYMLAVGVLLEAILLLVMLANTCLCFCVQLHTF